MKNDVIDFKHISVLLDECIEGLNIKPDGIYVDCTLGGAGHSIEIVKKLTTGKLIAIDKDPQALEFSKQKLKEYSDNIIFVHSDFKDIKNILSDLNINKVDGILADLGVSSFQLDTTERGFSYIRDAKLDMRMDLTSKFSAYNVVNEYSEKELANIIYIYGEEQFSRRIASAIVEKRKEKDIETTRELTDIIESVIPKKFHFKGNVSKKTFQAIRIEVNSELSGLDSALKDMSESLNKNGRLAVITFHSLEDRIAKNVFKELSTGCICDKSIPVCICNHKESLKLINKKPIIASKEELEHNKRSASAKLRIVQKIKYQGGHINGYLQKSCINGKR